MSIKQKTRISALLPSLLTKELRRASKERSVPQGRIIEEALRLWIRKRLECEARELSKMKFEDLPTEDEWLVLQTEWENEKEAG